MLLNGDLGISRSPEAAQKSSKKAATSVLRSPARISTIGSPAVTASLILLNGVDRDQ